MALPNCRGILICSAIVAAASVSLFANANQSEASAQSFKACVMANLAAEKAKQNPQAANLLAACSNEYQAFLNNLPSGAEAEVRHTTLHDIENLLKS